MTPSSTTSPDTARERLRAAVMSSDQRSPSEQRELLAGLLAEAFEANRQSD